MNYPTANNKYSLHNIIYYSIIFKKITPQTREMN